MGIWRRYPVLKQHDMTDCGPAALAMIALFHGKRFSIARLRELARTDRSGTALSGLIHAAESLGFRTRAVRAPLESLNAAVLPAVAHWVEKERKHFVVVYEFDSEGATIGDPASGLRRLTQEQFASCWTGVLLLVDPTPRLRLALESASPLHRLSRIVLSHRSLFLDALLAAVVMTILGLTSSLFIQVLIDHIVSDGHTPTLNALVVGMLLAVVARTVFSMIRAVLLTRLSQRIDAGTALEYFRHLLRLPVSFFEQRTTGEVLARLQDSAKIRIAAGFVTTGVIVDAVMLTIVSSVFVLAAPGLAWTVLVPFALLALAVLLSHKPMQAEQTRAIGRAADFEALVAESAVGATVLKCNRLEDLQSIRGEARFEEMLDASYRAQQLAIGTSTAGTFLIGASGAALLWTGGHQVITGDLTLGSMLALHSLAGLAAGPVERLAAAQPAISEAMVALGRMGEILELPTERERQTGPGHSAAVRGELRFEGLTIRFGYAPPILRSFDLRVRAGECIAIRGPSGCGKTSLVRTLLGLIVPAEGQVRVDGIDVRDWDLDSLRRGIAYVPQDVVLLTGTIEDNLRAGDLTASADELRAAAADSHVLGFIEQLPARFGTQVGERGVLLSGGQRQRLGIARALVSRPAVLVLDEPTSQLDRESEQAVQRILDDRRGRLTTLVITHRPLRVDRFVDIEGSYVPDAVPAGGVSQ